MKPIVKKIAPFISVVFFGFALWVLHEELGQYNLSEIGDYLSRLSVWHIVLSLVLCALSYLLLTGYDALGVEYVGEKLSYDKIFKAGFIGYAFSHNIGMALISGGSIRYRLYSAWGFTGVQVTKLVGFSAFTLWIGFCSMGGLSLLIYSPHLPKGLISFVPIHILSIILLAMVVVYLGASALVRNEVHIWKWSIAFPGTDMAIKQVLIASLDWLLAASVLFVLLPWREIPFFGFVGVFLLAQIIGLFSQVPGGLGVFESVMVLYLSNFMSSSNVVSVLLIYRLIYYLLPLIAAMGLLGQQEYRANRQVVNEFGSRTADLLHRVIPTAFSVSIFIGGAVLLFSGSMPAEVPLMHYLQPLIPLPVIEMSHFFASLVGAALLVLAHGLQRRMDAAYHATVGVLIFGIIFSLLKGVSYIEASILAIMLIALIPSRKQFNNRAALFSESFSPVWITMILMVVIGSIGLGWFTYGNLKYQEDLWWQFTLLGDAPRYLRASVGVFGAALLFGLFKLLRPAKASRKIAVDNMKPAQRIQAEWGDMRSNLLLLDDKNLLLNNAENAFIMYKIEDRSWISMGDPVGRTDRVEELVWDFKEQSERADSWPVFYQVRERYSKLYKDIGLTLLTLGQEARIALSTFSLQANLSKPFYTRYQQMQQAGYSFELIPPERMRMLSPALQAVSDGWLGMPHHQEKYFSLGHFDEAYLHHFPIGVVRKGDTIVAFSNLLCSAGQDEIGCDLLRYKSAEYELAIDFLLIELMQWSRNQGYKWFNLGLAPLSPKNSDPSSNQWNAFTEQLYNYEQQLYNFDGLRRHKAQFSPRWEPLYLASPAGLTLRTVLNNVSTLISGRRK